ncbi:MAG: hypothetical protein ACLTOV_00295 [Phocaeicola sp.]
MKKKFPICVSSITGITNKAVDRYVSSKTSYGLIDLSNNCCERQIRRIAKYRNNSFFVGSPESGVRFARLQSVFANIRNHKLNAVAYLCDVFRRIGKTAKEELVNLLPHKWQPMTV